MLDIHVIVRDTTPKTWVNQCLFTIRKEQQRAGYRSTLHICEPVMGHIGQARAAAYAKGSHPYVVHVDDDDYLLEHSLNLLRQPMLDKAEAIFTGEKEWQNGHIRDVPFRRHHLTAFHRDVLIDHSKWVAAGDQAQMAMLKGRGVDVHEPAYVWRIYRRPKLIHQHGPELEAARTFRG